VIADYQLSPLSFRLLNSDSFFFLLTFYFQDYVWIRSARNSNYCCGCSPDIWTEKNTQIGAALGKTLRGFKEEINQDEQEIEDSDEKMR
jgi:hypothetical protein